MNAFDKFSLKSGLKPDKAKCEIPGRDITSTLWDGLYWLNQKNNKNFRNTFFL